MNHYVLMLARELCAYESMLFYTRMGVINPPYRYVL